MSADRMLEAEVLKIAALVKLDLTKEEIAKFQVTIPETLVTIGVLDELDTQDVSPTSQVTGLTNVFRSAEVKETLSKELTLANACEVVRDLFATKAVFDRP